MVTIFLGPPGVGKGTQAKLLAGELRWLHVSTGDLLRAARRAGTELGRKAQAFMDAGELVPDALIMDLVREHLDERQDEGVIFDGFPRTETQARGLAEVLAEDGRSVDQVLLFEADDDLLVKRISGRRSCPRCGNVHNVYFTPPRAPGVCDQCGGSLTHRADDEAETVRRRL
jgi:adenylate kinase